VEAKEVEAKEGPIQNSAAGAMGPLAILTPLKSYSLVPANVWGPRKAAEEVCKLGGVSLWVMLSEG
jgi:hypothetical protein